MPEVNEPVRRPSFLDRIRRSALARIGAVLAFVVAAVGVVHNLTDGGLQRAFASNVVASEVSDPGGARDVSASMLLIAQRGDTVALFVGRYADIDVSFYRDVADSRVTKQILPDREVPPFIEIPTDRCPGNEGTSGVLKVFLLGDVGSGNIGHPSRETVSVNGQYELEPVKSPRPGNTPTFCWIDAWKQ